MEYSPKNIRLYQKGTSWSRRSPKELLSYAIGGLLYAPADHQTIGMDIVKKKYPALKSLALCLEDSIPDHKVASAQTALVEQLNHINRGWKAGLLLEEELPLLFIRVRSPRQILEICRMAKSAMEVVTGFILPKFDTSNMREYEKALLLINQGRSYPFYVMPILESEKLMDLSTRRRELLALSDWMNTMKAYVLNVRVGGNDFCRKYGLRRNSSQTIYEIGVVSSVLADIMNVFGSRYVVSAPVWEYFEGSGTKDWQKGLIRELRQDKLNGFIGKTAVHPSQLEWIAREMTVDFKDYMDAISVMLHGQKGTAVSKGEGDVRMNEMKVHAKWAYKTLMLSKIYGVKAENEVECIGESDEL